MSTSRKSTPFNLRHAVTGLCVTGALALAAGAAQAGVPGADFYIGAGVGQSNADVNTTNFDKKDLGWKVLVGGRFISYLGAEVDYIDFGKTKGGTVNSYKYKGLAGYGLFYIPIPLPVLDIYLKAGVARVDTDVKVTGSSFSTDDTQFAYGGGVQLKFGSFGIRGEYEQYKADVQGLKTKPTLLSLTFTKSFL